MVQEVQERRIDQFFSGPGARADDWRALVEAAKAWSAGSGDRARFERLLSQIAIMEEFHAYPGSRLMAALKERTAADDAPGVLALAMRITQALQTRSFRQHAGDWDVKADADSGHAGNAAARIRRNYHAPAVFRDADRDRHTLHGLVSSDAPSGASCAVRPMPSFTSRSLPAASRTPSAQRCSTPTSVPSSSMKALRCAPGTTRRCCVR